MLFYPKLSSTETYFSIVSDARNDGMFVSDRFTGFSVYHYTDNMAVPNIVQVELKKPHLQDSGMEVKRTSSLQHAVLGSKSYDLAAFSLDFQYFMVILEYFNFFHSSGLYDQLLE